MGHTRGSVEKKEKQRWVGIGRLESGQTPLPEVGGIGAWPQNGVEKKIKKETAPEMVWRRK